MTITSSTLGGCILDPFKITVLAANSYIPLYANYTQFKEEDVTFYKRPSFTDGILKKPNTLKHIKDSLEKALTPRKITIGGSNYFFLKGAMYTEDGNPLIVLGMSKETFENPQIPKFSDNGRYVVQDNSLFDYKNYVMFYSTSFFTDPNLTALNRRFQKEILMSCYEKGIEVRVIASSEIEKNTFARIFEIPKVNSVDQLEEYMNKVLPTLLYTEEEDTFVFEELKAPEIVQDHELSVEEEALLFDSESTIESVVGINTSSLYLETEEEIELLPIFRDPEIEEMEREAATWENSAHTEYPVTVDEAHPAIMYPDPPIYHNLVATGESVVHADYAIANAEAAITTHVTQVEDVTWRLRIVGSRDTRPIELIDDTE